MRAFLKYFYYTFPVQLFLLHFRKSQMLLFFWVILFMTISGHFMKPFGADGLFLAPEYLGAVSPLSEAILGIACGVYIMSWNITTFILHSERFRFLAATTNPFLKYCLNNAIIPVLFLLIYFNEAFHYSTQYELISTAKFFLLAFSFLGGLAGLLFVSFAYFFSADKRIIRYIQPGFIDFNEDGAAVVKTDKPDTPRFELPVTFYASSPLRFRKARDVSHYGLTFLDAIFKRHHFSAMVTILLAFIFLMVVGFFLDHQIFQVPAGASVFIIFAVILAAMGAIGYFLRSWNFIFLAGLFIVFNTLYNNGIINFRNRAYGLSYVNESRPGYNLDSLKKLNSPDKVASDKENMIEILGKWKKRQGEEKPLLVLMNFSGGGLRGASFSMNALQKLDSATGGKFMKRTFLMSGASGGMLGAAYFRELYRQREEGKQLNLQDKKYLDNTAKDLLNPVFSSMIARDFISPAQKFIYNGHQYVKDRGYAFEQKLNRNTEGVLDHNIGFYSAEEKNAEIPLMILNSVVTSDMRKMIISTQPVSFLMQYSFPDGKNVNAGPDAIDFAALFQAHSPMNLRLLSALRMNATYPYVLPSVTLPADPVIDVMDAGLRDNYGQETAFRFIDVFRDWIDENTRGVLILEMRSKKMGEWAENRTNYPIAEVITKPFSMIQKNWFNIQDYLQNDEITYARSVISVPLQRVLFMYEPPKAQSGVPLNFHLTSSEKKGVEKSLDGEANKYALELALRIMHDSTGID